MHLKFSNEFCHPKHKLNFTEFLQNQIKKWQQNNTFLFYFSYCTKNTFTKCHNMVITLPLQLKKLGKNWFKIKSHKIRKQKTNNMYKQAYKTFLSNANSRIFSCFNIPLFIQLLKGSEKRKKMERSSRAGKTGKQHQSAANQFFFPVFSLLPALGRARSGQECRLSWCYVWYMGRSEPKDNVPTIFTSPWMSAADGRSALALLHSWTTSTLSTGQLSAYLADPLQITLHKRWNVAAAPCPGHSRDSGGSGGLRWCPFPLLPPPASPRSPWVPSSPLAPGQWAILGSLEGPVQPFNPWPDPLSGGGVGEGVVQGRWEERHTSAWAVWGTVWQPLTVWWRVNVFHIELTTRNIFSIFYNFD